MGTHRRRAPAGRIAQLGFIALAVLLMALLFPPLSRLTAHAQANSPPQFPSEAITFTIDENTPPYSNIGSPVAAADDNNDALTYSLKNARLSHFGIDSSTGQLRAGSPLDYETRNSYTVKVIATDPSDSSDSVTVTITVNNVDEPGTVSLSWRQPQVGTELEAALTDPDGIVSGPTWQWSQPNGQNGDYSDITGATSASYTPVTGDAGKFLRATASYTDATASGKTAQMVSYRRVREEPSDNHAPAFPAPDNSGGGYGCPGSDPDRGVCLRVKRSSPVGAEIYQPARAEDPDDDEVRYSLEGPDVTSFGIVASTGGLLTKQLFRDVDQTAYTVTIKATDPSGEFDTVTATIRPSGSKGSPVVEGPEEIRYPENGTWRVATYTAENKRGPITGWIISVEPGGGDGDYFDINEDGVLTFDGTPDYEDPTDEGGNNKYSFHITAYDANPPHGERPAKTFLSVKVIITGVKEPEPPEITGPASVEYSEDRTDAVATYTVANPVAWTLPEDDAGDFSISNGVLTFNTPPDYEAKSVYSVTVTATDPSNASDSITVTVTVTDVEEAPEFPATETGARSVAENTEAGQNIGDPVTATDDDDDDALIYSLGVDDVESFDIVDSSGQLRTKATLDYETQASYTVTVSVSDSKDADGNADTATDATITVTITVTNVEEAPEFPATETGARSVAENTAADENIGDPVAATDDDDASLTYSLGGTDAGSFNIVESSGQLLTRATLDYEAKSSYSLTLSVSDSKDAGGNADTATDDTIPVTITVTDVEEAGTVDLSSVQPQVDTLLTTTLSDPDGDVTGTTWEWESSPDQTNWAAITGATEGSYTPVTGDVGNYLRVTASYADGEGSGKSAQAVSANTVQAAPLTNSAPVFSSDPATREIAENTPTGRNIGNPVVATDGDDDDASLTYSLGGDNAASFDLSASGQLLTKDALDYEAKSSYSVTVTATDPSDASDIITVTITVTDVEEAPEFPAGESGARSVAENTAAGRNIGRPVAATDGDRDSLTYSLGGTDAASFDIRESSGQLLTKATLNYEDKSSYSVTVSVRDNKGAGGNADTATDDMITVTITVTDVDESPPPPVQPRVVSYTPKFNRAPAFAEGDSADRSVAERTAAGTNIDRPVNATDYDGDSLTYSLGGTDAGSFDIVAPSGQLLAKDPLDYETNSSYSVTVSVSDGKDVRGNADTTVDDTITVTITVTDEEEAPEFPAGETAARTVAENTEAGQNIGAPIAAADDDGDSLTYSLGGTDAASFDIVAPAGQLLTKDPLDYETAPSYSVIVSVSDSKDAGGDADTAADDTVTVTITVSNEEEAPEFPDGEPGARSVAENTEAGENIGGPVAAVDDDGDSLTYSLGGDDAASFDIVASSGQLLTKAALDYEAKSSYTVTVSVSDSKDAGGNADTATDGTITVTITVANVEETPGFPTGESEARSVAENTEAGENIGDPVAATDDDGDSLTYSLSGDDAASFGIVASSGQLLTKGALDYETGSSYSVTVSVSDSKDAGGNADTATDDTIAVTITVTNVEEAGTVDLSSVQPQVDIPLTATLSDPDGGVTGTTWEWESSSDQTNWTAITGATEGSYTPVAGDVGNYLRVTASYTDGEGSGKSAQAVSDNAVQAAPITNTAPEFSGDPATREIAENTAAGENIGNPLVATDDDDDALTYALGGTDEESFDIVPSSGQLRTEASLDYETKSSYAVIVTATDPSDASDSIIVTITLTDVDEPLAAPVSGTTDDTGNDADPIGASIASFPLGGDSAFLAAGNAMESASIDVQTTPLPTTDTETSSGSLVAMIMMIVGAVLVGVGTYLVRRDPLPQRVFHPQRRAVLSPAFSVGAGILK